ncbi:hypothetical protein [Andreprevotia chitinilytica]|uniref:hypothetical protein n=1 Tax=Andreprevotia chitinilytica TaxID=396808 RepID=UPI00069215EF|nr:hypothetical protein [Andreprevotia chitinilytica]
MKAYSQHLLVRVFFVLSGLLCVLPGLAQAAVLTCEGTGMLTYSPGFTNTPQLITVKGDAIVGPCVGLPAGLAAKWHFEGQGTLGCQLLPNAVAGGYGTVSWNDGTTSMANFVSALTTRTITGDLVTVSTLKIVSGKFDQQTLNITATLLQTDALACFTPQGVTSVTGPFELSVLPL